MAKEEKTLSEQDRQRIEQWVNSKRFYSYEDRRCLMEGAEYEHKYQREQQAEVRNKVIEEILLKLDERLSEHVTHEGDYIAVRIHELQEITNLLNSLKTK